MFYGVWLYRCKCGVGLEVLTETDKTRIDEDIHLEVACPKCQEKQVINAHRITKIEVELPAQNQNKMWELMRQKARLDTLVFAANAPSEQNPREIR
jgi:hypothetical protein